MRRRLLVAALSVVMLGACTHVGDERDAVRAVLHRLDPQNSAVILARDDQVERVRKLVGSKRVVEAVTRFARQHPEDPVPFNIMFQSAEVKGDAVLVRVHFQAISHPPPMVMACGTSFLFEVKRERGEWVLRQLEAAVC